MTVTLGHGARVFVPLEQDPDQGGGPIRRSPLTIVPIRYNQMVRRTPHAVVYEPEPGQNPSLDPYSKAFLPDGRIVSRDVFPRWTNFSGALGATPGDDVLSAMKGLLMWGIVGGSLIGMSFGGVLSNRQGAGRAVDAGVGAGLGALAGLAGSILVGRGSSLASRLVAAQKYAPSDE